MKVIASGSRHYKRTVTSCPFMALDWLLTWAVCAEEELVIPHGAARGFDTEVELWVRMQQRNSAPVRTIPYPALWNKLGKRAGRVRNDLMLVEQLVGLDMLLALPHPEGSGTQHMMDIAKAAQIPIWELEWGSQRLSAPPQARLVPGGIQDWWLRFDRGPGGKR